MSQVQAARKIDAIKNAVVEAALGRRVLVVAPGWDAQREAVNLAADLSLHLNIVKVNKWAQNCFVEYSSGGKMVIAASADGARGRLADVVYVHESFNDAHLEVIKPVILSSVDGVLLRYS